MRATTESNTPLDRKVAVSTADLQSMLGCGRRSATLIGEQAEAKIIIGRRVLWNVEKVKEYVNRISM